MKDGANGNDVKRALLAEWKAKQEKEKKKEMNLGKDPFINKMIQLVQFVPAYQRSERERRAEIKETILCALFPPIVIKAQKPQCWFCRTYKVNRVHLLPSF
jgi:hypothetical protein